MCYEVSPTVDSHGKHGIFALRPARRGDFTRLRPLPIFILFAILIGALLLTFPTPYALLAAIFPPSTIVRVPPRWVIPALFALSGLAAFGFAMLNSQFTFKNSKFISSRLFFVVIVSVLLLETLSIPLPLAQVDNHNTLNPAYHWLAEQPDHFALIELPLHSAPEPEFPEVKRLYASTSGLVAAGQRLLRLHATPSTPVSPGSVQFS